MSIAVKERARSLPAPRVAVPAVSIRVDHVQLFWRGGGEERGVIVHPPPKVKSGCPPIARHVPCSTSEAPLDLKVKTCAHKRARACVCACVRRDECARKEAGARGCSRERDSGGAQTVDRDRTHGRFVGGEDPNKGPAAHGGNESKGGTNNTWSWRVAHGRGGSRHAADSPNVVEGEVTSEGRSGRVPGEGRPGGGKGRVGVVVVIIHRTRSRLVSGGGRGPRT